MHWAGPARSSSLNETADRVVREPGPLKLERTECKPTWPKLAWVADRRVKERWLVADFANDTVAAPRGAAVASVGVYLLSLGSLEPPLTAITLLVVPEGQTEPRMVPVTVEGTQLVCPGVTRFAVSSADASGVLTKAQFNKASVVGVRIDVNSARVAGNPALPFVAAVGLEVRL